MFWDAVRATSGAAAANSRDVDGFFNHADFFVATRAGYLIAIETKVTPELADEGMARELAHRIQNLRKGARFEITDHIVTYYQGPDDVARVMSGHGDYIKQETLSDALLSEPPAEEAHAETAKVEGMEVTLGVLRLSSWKESIKREKNYLNQLTDNILNLHRQALLREDEPWEVQYSGPDIAKHFMYAYRNPLKDLTGASAITRRWDRPRRGGMMVAQQAVEESSNPYVSLQIAGEPVTFSVRALPRRSTDERIGEYQVLAGEVASRIIDMRPAVAPGGRAYRDTLRWFRLSKALSVGAPELPQTANRSQFNTSNPRMA